MAKTKLQDCTTTGSGLKLQCKNGNVKDPAAMTAAEAFADLYRTLSPAAGYSWLADSRLDDSSGLFLEPALPPFPPKL